jgi:coatomer subunit beta'
VKTFKNFKEVKSFKPDFSAESIFGGSLLGVRSRDFVCLYDWETTRVVRRIEVVPRQIYWSDNNELLAIACESSFYILKYNKQAVMNHFASGRQKRTKACPPKRYLFLCSGKADQEEGVAEAFEVLQEVQEKYEAIQAEEERDSRKIVVVVVMAFCFVW